MNILAMDSSSQALSVALASETGVWHTEIDAGTRHSELLMECVDGLCKMANLCPGDLNMVSCMKGPGSFTGLRIGFSTAKGFALALGIPLVAIPTLDCLAYPFSTWPGIVLPVLDAKRDCFFAAFYREAKRLTDYLDASPEALIREAIKAKLFPGEPIFLTGAGAQLLYSRLVSNNAADFIKHNGITMDPEFARGRAKDLLKMIKSGCLYVEDTIDSGPIYVRKSDAEENRERK